MRYRELRVELFKDNDRSTSYRVGLRSPEGKWDGTFSVPMTSYEVAAAYGNIYDANRGIQRFQPESLDPMKDLGSRLFLSLFSEEAPRWLYNRCCSQLEDRDDGLRLRLVTQDEVVAALPWEFLFDVFRQDFVALSPRTALVREWSNATTSKPSPGPASPPLRILVVTEDPDGSFGAERETQLLERLQTDASVPVELAVRHRTTPNELRRALGEQRYHIVHFVGHGGDVPQPYETRTQQSLVLKGEGSQSARVGPAQLLRLLQEQPEVRLVFLNACQTDQLAGQLSTQVPAALAQRDRPSAEACLAFCEGLYRGLFTGQSLEAAVAQGRQEVDSRLPGSREWALPVLYMRVEEGTVLAPPSRPANAPAAMAFHASSGAPDEGREVLQMELILWQRNLQSLQQQLRGGVGSRSSVQAQIDEVQARIQRLETELLATGK
jgi:hypothetical protein